MTRLAVAGLVGIMFGTLLGAALGHHLEALFAEPELEAEAVG
jgi:hypothetical protein